MSAVKIVNLTNSMIRLYPDGYTDIPIPVSRADEVKFLGRCIEIKSTGHARSQISREAEVKKITIGAKDKQIKSTMYYSHIGVVTGLPEPEQDTIYIVSQLTYNAIHHLRKDVFIIDKPIRSESGGVIACRGFSRCVYDKDNLQLNIIDNYLKKRFSQLPKCDEATEVSNCIIVLSEYRKP